MTRDGQDPERSQGVAERVDARHYGEPDDYRPEHVAPPCEECREREAVGTVDGRLLCGDCLPDLSDD